MTKLLNTFLTAMRWYLTSRTSELQFFNSLIETKTTSIKPWRIGYNLPTIIMFSTKLGTSFMAISCGRTGRNVTVEFSSNIGTWMLVSSQFKPQFGSPSTPLLGQRKQVSYRAERKSSFMTGNSNLTL